jgi:glycosyltransferase involved in cell wall biosynthesis
MIQRQFGHLPRDVYDYIALSDQSKELLRPYLPRDAQIYSVANPIEVEKAAPVDVARNRTLVAVGRLDIEKGIEILLEAARRSGTRLTLIGDGPLRHVAEASGVCRVTGWLSRDAVFAELRLARCLVFPSIWYETYGLAVAEAAALGIPAIVSDICAAAERVENGMTGWHARAGDVSDMIRCLDIVNEDDAVAAAGKAAYAKFWSRPPTRDQHVADLTAVYRAMLNAYDTPTGQAR